MTETEKIMTWLEKSKCPLCGGEMYTDGFLMVCSRWGRGRCTFRAKLERY